MCLLSLLLKAGIAIHNYNIGSDVQSMDYNNPSVSQALVLECSPQTPKCTTVPIPYVKVS